MSKHQNRVYSTQPSNTAVKVWDLAVAGVVDVLLEVFVLDGDRRVVEIVRYELIADLGAREPAVADEGAAETDATGVRDVIVFLGREAERRASSRRPCGRRSWPARPRTARRAASLVS